MGQSKPNDLDLSFSEREDNLREQGDQVVNVGKRIVQAKRPRVDMPLIPTRNPARVHQGR